jgi:hypothetical protein
MRFVQFVLGILAGLAAILFGYVAAEIHGSGLRLTSSDLATLVAGFAGIVGGGLITYAIARQTAAANAAVEQKRSDDADKATMLHLIIKVMQLTNSIYNLERHIEGSLERGVEPNQTMPSQLWRMVTPLARGDIPINFEASDYFVLAVSRQADLINRIFRVYAQHEALLAGFSEYCQRHVAFQEFARRSTSINPDDHASISAFENEAMIEAQNRGMELEQLIKQIRVVCLELRPESEALSRDLDVFARAYFKGKGGFISIGPEPKPPSA